MRHAIPTITDGGFDFDLQPSGALVIRRKYLDMHTLMIETIGVIVSPPVSEDDINAGKAAILEVIEGEKTGVFTHQDLPGYKFGLVNDNRVGLDKILDELTDGDGAVVD